MRTATKLFFAGALLAASSASLVAAAAVNIDVNIGVPGYSTVVPQPVYYYSPPVYYYPPPVYYSPAPRAFIHHRDWDRRWDRHHRHKDRHHRHEDRRRW